MHQLSKTDFKYYLDCPESLWLLKNKPTEYPKGEFSLFAEKLIKEGYEVEGYAKQLFENGIDIPENENAAFTARVLKGSASVFFQAAFSTEKGIFARVDIVERLADGTWHIYEVKSSTSIKKDRKHRHIEDACFQKYVLQECGYTVSKVSIIHLNMAYIRQGDLNIEQLLVTTEVTKDVDAMYSAVVATINAASNFINKTTITEMECSCKYKTRNNHCDSFEYFNSDIPEYSIYEIGRISEKKIGLLVDDAHLAITDIPEDFRLSKNQKIQVESAREELVVIDKKAIRRTLLGLLFPLHFVDYETYPTAVPKLDGMSPHKHLVFQVSIHTMQKDGTLTHFEWLGDAVEQPTDMLKKMQEFTGLSGTFVSWSASFEIGRNNNMKAWMPEHSTYLSYMNNYMFDLMTFFRQDYVDYRFQGYTSIKKVLPVLCPQLSYKDLMVQDGTMALDTWGRMVTDPSFNEDVELTRKNLLDYCKLDTLAMVEIYKVLKKL